MKYKVGIIIVSDRASTGERKDQCLSIFEASLDNKQFEICESVIVSDEPDEIRSALEGMLDKKYHLVFTSGGTGCGPRDCTPDVTGALLDKPTPGLDEVIRAFSQDKSPHAMFSRAVSGVAGESYIVNLPGSPQAVGEILEFLGPIIIHPLKLMSGQISDCVEEVSRHD